MAKIGFPADCTLCDSLCCAERSAPAQRQCGANIQQHVWVGWLDPRGDPAEQVSLAASSVVNLTVLGADGKGIGRAEVKVVTSGSRLRTRASRIPM